MALSENEDNIADRLTKVAKIVKEDIEEHYGMRFEVFHERVHAEFGDSDEETYIRFHIVFDGNFDDLQDRRRKREIGIVRDLLASFGISEFPVLSFVSRAEWTRERHKLLVNAQRD